jgi:hypothetical protein
MRRSSRRFRRIVYIVNRVLDIDLDFFVSPVVYWPSDEGRPPDDEYEVWPIDDALAFLRDRCGLAGRMPGFVTERHDEVFARWREAIQSGLLQKPFHVTHLDAHADLGVGDASWTYVLTDLLTRPVEDRQFPLEGDMTGLSEGNFLLFSIACQWLGELVYVHGDDSESDISPWIMEGFDLASPNIQLPEISESAKMAVLTGGMRNPIPTRLEPMVAFQEFVPTEFRSTGSYDLICITRSPQYAPEKADALYSRIIEEFIDPLP